MSDVRKIYRSREQRMVAGVAGGLAEYFNMDPTLVRLIFVALSLLGGPGFFIYIIMWVVVPEAPTYDEKPKNDF